MTVLGAKERERAAGARRETTGASAVSVRGENAARFEEDSAEIEVTSVGADEQTLGRYRLCFEVAQGGMATVFLARTQGPAGFGRFVALKRIHAHLAREKQFVEMFLDEARIASMLSHPNTCGVTDFGEASGTYYLTMDYLVGESYAKLGQHLAKRARAGTADDIVPLVCRMIADACEGLHSAHELRDPRGNPLDVVHRDISPHNLFVTYDGTVKVVDFGIASAAGRLHHTQTGTLKGKFAYMAPEQLDGRGCDRRVDVWALGVVLWESIAHKRLFRKPSDSETLLAVMGMPIPKLAELRPSVPVELDRIVQKALARKVEERYATTRDFGRDLVRFLATRRESVGMVEIAELMERVFPSGLSQKQQLLQVAAQLGDGTIPNVPALSSDAQDASLSATATGSLEALTSPRNRSTTALVGALGTLGIIGVMAIFYVRSPPAIVANTRAVSAVTATIAAPEAAPVVTRPSAPPEPRAEVVSPPPVAVVAAAPVAATAPTPAPLAAPTAPAVATVAPVRRGTVNVTTPGAWADVYAGGRKLGQTPGQFSLPSGRQTLTLRPFGGPTARRVSVQVVPDGVTRVRVDLSAP